MLQLWRKIILRNVRATVMLDVIPMPTAATQSQRGSHLRPKLTVTAIVSKDKMSIHE